MTSMSDDLSKVGEFIRRHSGERSELISILHDVQDEYNYLPTGALKIVADELKMREIEVIGVASFYKAFSLVPRGKHLINVCMGTACHVRGAPRILDEVQRKLGIRSGETTEDWLFTLRTVNCVGACALGPIIIIDDEYHGQMKVDKTGRLIKKVSGQRKET